MTPTIKRSIGIINNKCPIPGANNVTVDSGPNNWGNPIKINKGIRKLNTMRENQLTTVRKIDVL